MVFTSAQASGCHCVHLYHIIRLNTQTSASLDTRYSLSYLYTGLMAQMLAPNAGPEDWPGWGNFGRFLGVFFGFFQIFFELMEIKVG